ncbi:AraC family transcriptional regulator [Noviherbaspirillum suwonense]|uniref:Transcriptional regulator, AraC family n=1 Tax=Noviherbaspirillum suwonense TaxID=1224511 RepID=A0ABY1QVS6_9BURK|nr:AraC family transcriptional regulator [Noviherbaspirillum suwonense]SMP80122.1 transcriptional regulator, AraC family [Noviherbaspirillum suwonense]
MNDELLISLLPRFNFAAETFFSGEFCGSNDFSENQNISHLHFVRRGPVTMAHDDGSTIVAVEPTIIFYPRPYNHRLIVAPGTEAELVCANVQFKEAERNPFAQSLPNYLAIPLAEVDSIGEIVELLFARAATQSFGKRFMMDKLSDILVFEVIRHAMETGQLKAGVLTGFADVGIARVLTLIHENPAQEWQIGTLAAEASMSRSKFAKKFHDLVGISPAAYIAEWRLVLAENLLRQGQSVKSVARAVGYGTPQSFARVFMERRGKTPKQWAAHVEKPDSSEMEESGRWNG